MAQLLMPFSNTEKTQIIRKSNELIEARYKLSVAEQRLVMLLASEISPDDEDFKSYEIRVSDFAKMFGLEKCNSMYSEVQKAAKELVGKRLDLSRNGKEIYTTWLSYVEYIDGSGVVNLEFHASLKPYFLQLKGYYTQYQLHHVMNFKSQYSMRLYELLKMDAFKVNKHGQFEKSFELQEYRELLGVEKKAYSIFADFRKNVVQPLVSEISDKTDLFINDVKYGKTGRKITNITFSVGVRSEQDTKLRQANLRIEDIQPENTSENHAVIDTLVSLGFSLEVAKKVFNKHTIKKIERNIAYTLAKKQAGLVKDIPAYLNNAIENDYGGAWDIENQKKVEAKKQKDKQEAEKQAKDDKIALEKKAKFQQVFDTFQSLPTEQQEELKKEFLEKSNNTIVEQAREAQKKGKDILSSNLVSSNFKVFLIEQKGF
jgi:plasmid replication initiation protein